MIDKLQEIKGKTSIKIYQNVSDYYDEMNVKRQINTFQIEIHFIFLL